MSVSSNMTVYLSAFAAMAHADIMEWPMYLILHFLTKTSTCGSDRAFIICNHFIGSLHVECLLVYKNNFPYNCDTTYLVKCYFSIIIGCWKRHRLNHENYLIKYQSLQVNYNLFLSTDKFSLINCDSYLWFWIIWQLSFEAAICRYDKIIKPAYEIEY